MRDVLLGIYLAMLNLKMEIFTNIFTDVVEIKLRRRQLYCNHVLYLYVFKDINFIILPYFIQYF